MRFSVFRRHAEWLPLRAALRRFARFNGILPLCVLLEAQREPKRSPLLPIVRAWRRTTSAAAVVDKTFDGSLPRFVAAFLNSKPISDAEAAEIRALLDAARYKEE